MTDPSKQTPTEPRAEDEPIDLAEARAAKALARALDGEDPGENAEVLEALEAAAEVKAVAEPHVPQEAIDRIGDELFGPARRRSPWRAVAGIAVAACLAAGVAGVLVARHGTSSRAVVADTQIEAGPLRAQAELLLASLMPPGDGAAGRAERVADDAAARLRSSCQGGRP